MEPFEDLDTAIERRRQMRIRRRRRLYVRRALLLSACVALLALLIATPIWIVRGIRGHRDRMKDSQADTTPTVTQTTVPLEQKPAIPAVDASTVWLGSEVQSEYAVLLDMTEGRVVAAKNPLAQANPASITKVMTLLVAVENITDLDGTFTMSYTIIDPVYTQEASVTGLLSGETVRLRDLLYGCILPSGADAAIALATHVAGSEEAFAELMNRRAAELGATATHFTNASGLHGREHKTTAMDMALIMAAAMENEVCREVLMTRRYTSPSTSYHPEGLLWESTLFGRIASDDHRILAGKTGYTDQAMNTLVTYTVGADKHEYVFVTMYVNGHEKAMQDAYYMYYESPYCK